MKWGVTLVFPFLLYSTLSGCKKHSSGGTASDTGNGWTLGSYQYTESFAAGAGEQSTSKDLGDDGSTTTIIASTANGSVGNSQNLGAYSGSTLTIQFHSNLGSGNYTIAGMKAFEYNPDAKFMYLSCIVGTAVSTGANAYNLTDSTVSGSYATVSPDATGKYHVTLSTAVQLPLALTVVGGINGAQNSYPLLINDVY